MDIKSLIADRHSTRSYQDKPVSNEVIREVLELASHAPSGSNTQPWKVAVVTGKTKDSITQKLLEARANNLAENPDYQYYPSSWFDPYKERRFKCGMALYSALDIKREDKARRLDVWNDNYRFFGAPVGLFFFIDKALDKGSWVDMGMFIQNVMLAACACGLATCPQASLSEYPDIIRSQLDISSDFQLICGLSMGYENTEHPINQYRTERDPVDQFTTWHN